MANTEHPINGMMDTTLEKIRQMVDANTIIGAPITTEDGSTILPVSKVTFAFTSAGTDYVSSKVPKDLFGGGTAAGVTVTPLGFLVIAAGKVRFIQMADKNSSIDRVLNLVPEVIDKITDLVGGKKNSEKKEETANPADTVVEEEVVVVE